MLKRLTILIFLSINFLYASVGKITAINGKAYIIRSDKKISIKDGAEIESNDTIQTLNSTKLQILFNDNTIISLGQKSIFKIEEFINTNRKKSARFHIKRGLFKSITGKIGHIAPKNFVLKTANATIGVRGTTVIAKVSKDLDEIICSSGKIVVSSNRGYVFLNRGEGTSVRRSKAPTPAKNVSTSTIIDLKKSVEPQVKTDIDTNNEIANDRTIKTISNTDDKIKEDWGEWSSSDKIEKEIKDIGTPEDNKPKSELSHLRELIGASKTSYSGKISGFVDSRDNKIVEDKSSINLDFDLGDGTLNGDMKFSSQKGQQFQSDLKGRVDRYGQFEFDLNRGDGAGELKGEHLEHANGSFSMENQNQNRAYGTFNTSRNKK